MILLFGNMRYRGEGFAVITVVAATTEVPGYRFTGSDAQPQGHLG